MRPGTVLAERDDRVERGAVGARLVPRLLQPPGELRLRTADERLLGELLVDPVGDRARTADRIELTGLLDRAQRLDEAGGRDELDPSRAQRVGRRERQVCGLDADPAAGEQLGERRHDVARRPVELDALDLARGLGVAEIGVERRLTRRFDEHRRVRAVETRQVADVYEPGDEQWILQLRCKPLDPGHASPSSASSSSARR
ncbi:MAG: hypothetical protein M5U27_02085 [Gaiella sp.]|nr:hypothetical protein [Gaiella sp.]